MQGGRQAGEQATAAKPWWSAAAIACALLLGLILSPPAAIAGPQHAAPQHTAPKESPRPAPPPAAHPPANGGNHPEAPGQYHLGPWLQKHQNMSPAEQENAIRREPGFNRLPAETQQRLMQRFQNLNSMPPEQRQRTLSRMEAMERLTPPQREEVRRSAQELGGLPPDRQRMVRKAFRDLRDIPGEQRDAVLNSPRFQGQFSPQERNILGNLLKVEPYQGGHSSIPGAEGVPAGG